jgi:hypothetical protein
MEALARLPCHAVPCELDIRVTRPHRPGRGWGGVEGLGGTQGWRRSRRGKSWQVCCRVFKACVQKRPQKALRVFWGACVPVVLPPCCRGDSRAGQRSENLGRACTDAIRQRMIKRVKRGRKGAPFGGSIWGRRAVLPRGGLWGLPPRGRAAARPHRIYGSQSRITKPTTSNK